MRLYHVVHCYFRREQFQITNQPSVLAAYQALSAPDCLVIIGKPRQLFVCTYVQLSLKDMHSLQ